MQKIRFCLVIFICCAFPGLCWALDMEVLKIDFLQGNYRRVIFEGQAEVERMHLSNMDELNYILGLSYLKESKIDLAQNCFRRILNNSNSKFKEVASLGLGDTYLVSGQFQQAEDVYNKLIVDDSNSSQKPAVLYRLSQLELKKGNHQKSNSYWFKLKQDFPLSPELRSTKGIPLVNIPVNINDLSEYSVQVGFFTSSANANNFKETLSAKGHSAYVESFGAGFRVKVGRFKTEKEALELESKLAQEGFPTKVCPQ
ncbi:MAG: SPOR domain-containing protein [Candidatus Omnitrophica bacterium]|nr:SPOR domain-containing protein [Candidatus Omnitrophota bacterium]